jgi:SAM-dependent methyltransferase
VMTALRAYFGRFAPHRRRRQQSGAATFRYRDFDIPVDLARLTGGGPETWDVIGPGHILQYERYAPISRHHTVLELGCGIGRDAIELTRVLGPHGHYIGVDIIRPSIDWGTRKHQRALSSVRVPPL